MLSEKLTGKQIDWWTETARVWWGYSIHRRWLGPKLSRGVYTSTTKSSSPSRLPPPFTRQPVLDTFSRSVPRSSWQRKQRAGAVKPKVKQGGTRHQRSQYATVQPGQATQS